MMATDGPPLPVPMDGIHKPPQRRRWVPVSVRMLAAFLFLFGVWGGTTACRRVVAIREIERVGGQIGFNRGGPKWLRELLGDKLMQYFDAVEYVHFLPGPDDYLRDPRGLRGTRVLPYALGPTVDDATLAYLRRFPELKSLDLRCARITDAGVMRLSQLQKLEILDLEDTNVSDASAPVLARMPALANLNVSHTRLTAEGLAKLAGHRKLQIIEIDESQVAPASIASLATMPALQNVWLPEMDYHQAVPLGKKLMNALPGVAVQ